MSVSLDSSRRKGAKIPPPLVRSNSFRAWGSPMTRIAPCVITALALGLSACTNPYDPVQRGFAGGLWGAASGAAIGAAAIPWRTEIGGMFRVAGISEVGGSGVIASLLFTVGKHLTSLHIEAAV